MLSYRHFLVLWWVGVLFPVCSPSLAQDYELSVQGVNEHLIPRKEHLDSLALYRYTNEYVRDLRSKGYWLASLDSMKWDQDTVFCYFYQGRKFDKVRMVVDPNEKDDLRAKESTIRDVQQASQFLDEQIVWYENHGYPFAAALIDSSKLVDDVLLLYLQIDPGMYITYDSIQVAPGDILSGKFLSQYLQLGYDRAYDESKINQISRRIENLPAVSLESIESHFRLQKAEVALELKQEKVNRFDGVLGLVPAGDDNEKVQLTGELNLSLKNLFHSAKEFDLHWEKYTDNSQSLEASYLHPAFLGTPLDLYLSYDQLKEDSLFSNRNLVAGLDFYTGGWIRWRVSYQNQLGNELNDESDSSGNFTIDYYGLSVNGWRVDSRQHPKKGQLFSLSAQVGQKEIRKDTVANRNITQYKAEVSLKTHHKIARRSVIYGALAAGWLQSDELYLNDLFRLGGLRSIRGFNENAFYAGEYVRGSLEWRFYIEEYSYLVAFFDQGILSYGIESGRYSDQPSGLGFGMQFDTAAGSFQLLYGLGRRDGQEFSFDSSKIHFGYSALF